jgi:hypothetical protein
MRVRLQIHGFFDLGENLGRQKIEALKCILEHLQQGMLEEIAPDDIKIVVDTTDLSGVLFHIVDCKEHGIHSFFYNTPSNKDAYISPITNRETQLCPKSLMVQISG